MTLDPTEFSPRTNSNDPAGDPVQVVDLNLCGYGRVHALQKHLRKEMLAGRQPETVILTEHPPVITLGRAADPANLTAAAERLENLGIEVAHVERGGDVTYHGPGQLVVYPVLRLRQGVRKFVHALAESARATCGEFGIDARWDESRPGLWVGDAKIAAFGIHVHRSVSIHGLALNVSVDLSAFSLIVPCGLSGARVTSMAEVLAEPPPMGRVKDRLLGHLMEFTGRNCGTFFQDHDFFSYLGRTF